MFAACFQRAYLTALHRQDDSIRHFHLSHMFNIDAGGCQAGSARGFGLVSFTLCAKNHQSLTMTRWRSFVWLHQSYRRYQNINDPNTWLLSVMWPGHIHVQLRGEGNGISVSVFKWGKLGVKCLFHVVHPSVEHTDPTGEGRRRRTDRCLRRSSDHFLLSLTDTQNAASLFWNDRFCRKLKCLRQDFLSGVFWCRTDSIGRRLIWSDYRQLDHLTD